MKVHWACQKRHINVCVHVSAGVWVWGSVYVWMLDQARWWSGWLVLAELISQFPGWGELNANRLSCCFPDQAGCFLMRQADRELSHWRGAWHMKMRPRSACWDWEGRLGGTERVKEWKRGEGWGGGGREAYQLSEDWVTGQGRWLSSKTPRRAFEWQETKGTSLHTQQWLQTLLSGLSLSSDRPTRTNPVLLTSQEYQQNSAYWSTFRTSEFLITTTKIQSASYLLLSKFLPVSLSFDFSLW